MRGGDELSLSAAQLTLLRMKIAISKWHESEKVFLNDPSPQHKHIVRHVRVSSGG